jgi:hypothetical protein
MKICEVELSNDVVETIHYLLCHGDRDEAEHILLDAVSLDRATVNNVLEGVAKLGLKDPWEYMTGQVCSER